MTLKLPKQGSVDRSIPLSSHLITIAITDSHGNVIEKLGTPLGGPYGSVPGDPAWFLEKVDPRLAVCQVLAPYSAMQCLRSRGYF
jgi:hypothetical protein